MRLTQIIGMGVLVVGVVLLVLGYHASQAPLDQVSNTVTGHYSDRTTWYLVGGAAAVVVGLIAAVAGWRRA